MLINNNWFAQKNLKHKVGTFPPSNSLYKNHLGLASDLIQLELKTEPWEIFNVVEIKNLWEQSPFLCEYNTWV